MQGAGLPICSNLLLTYFKRQITVVVYTLDFIVEIPFHNS